MRLQLAFACFGLALSACAADGLQTGVSDRALADRAASRAGSPDASPRILRSDRLAHRPNTHICVWTNLDPGALAILEPSGEELSVNPFTSRARSDVAQALHDRNLPIRVKDEDQTLVVLGPVHPNQAANCRRADAIEITQTVLPGPAPNSYRVRLTATQGSRIYVAEILRPHALIISAEERFGLGEMNAWRADGKPFWSVHGDFGTLRNLFIRHLFGEAFHGGNDNQRR